MKKDDIEAVHPVWGLAVLAAAAAIASAILIGVPMMFAKLFQIPSFAALSQPTIESLFTLSTFGLLILTAFFAIRFDAVPVPLGRRKGLAAGTGIGLGVVGLALALALCAIAGTAHLGLSANMGAGLFILETVLVLIQSGAEEFYFRGWLQKDLERRWGPWPALCAAAFLFAALHFIAGASQPISFVMLLLGGLVFGLSYQKSGSFLLPWGIHFGWNWAEEMIFGAYPNPGVGTFGSLVNVELVGSSLWGGSDEGLNASLAAIIVLIAILAAVFAWPSRTETGKGEALNLNPARG